MHRKPIHRGGILSAGYDRIGRVLEIEFDTHRILRYEGVGQAVADRFLESDSPLSHYKDEIEEEYPCREVGQENKSAEPCLSPNSIEVPYFCSVAFFSSASTSSLARLTFSAATASLTSVPAVA